MNIKNLVLLFVVLICSFSCSDNNDPESEENNSDTTTIYDLFPSYDDYHSLYYAGFVILENSNTHEQKQFSVEEAGLLLIETNTEWTLPNDAPYLFNGHYVRLIEKNEVCYNEVLEMFPNYLYYEYLYRIEHLFELENTTTNEREQFEVNTAERLLRTTDVEWKIPDDAPYVLDSGNTYGLWLVKISTFCNELSK